MEFEKHYVRDAAANGPSGNLDIFSKVSAHATGIAEMFAKYAGATFNRGIYRLFPVDQLRKWNGIVAEMFPHLQGKILVFGSDWRGQIYALNATRKENDQYQVQLLDPASKESLNIPATFEGFHNVELVEYPNDSLQVELYEQWLAAKEVSPAASECVGYIKPLRLGGEDSISNQEITDMEVYWSLSTQIWQQT